MTRLIIIKTAAAALLVFSLCPAAGIEEPNDQTVAAARQPRQRVETVTMVEFYLRDGKAVSGKLLSEDKNQLTVEQLEESTIVVRSYTRRDIDGRTLATRPLFEWRYYVQMGDYFAARTWDFVDDPDDFIAAIRSYEKARQSLVSQYAGAERIAEIDALLAKIRQDKEVWANQVESRAKLKQLEYQAEAENRLKKLESRIIESNEKLNEGLRAIDKTAETIRNDYQRLERAVNGMNRDFAEQVRNIDARIQELRLLVNDLQLRVYLITRPTAP